MPFSASCLLLAVAKQDRVLNGDRHDHAKPDPRSSLAGWRSDAARFYMAPRHARGSCAANRRAQKNEVLGAAIHRPLTSAYKKYCWLGWVTARRRGGRA